MAEIMPQGVQLRDLDDIDATRDAIYDSTLKAFQQLPPVNNNRYQLDLSDIGYQGRDRYSRAEENRAILEGRSLHRRLTGTWNFRDPTGKVLESKRLTLANVPYMTSLGTFINNGSEYNLSNQLRLRPGVYAREKETGELESHVNVARGFGHRYFLDPATGVFRIQLAQSRMPLVPLLKTLGATDDQIRSAWGNELWSANVAKHDPTVLRKIYQKIYQGKAPGDEQSMADAVRKSFNDIELDPEVTQQTLGKPYAKLNVDAILDATKKLLAVQRGEADTDDRDAMHYQKIMTADDLFADRVKQAKKVMYSQLWKMTNQGNLNRMPPALFDKLLRGTILDSGLGQVLEEINTGEILDRRMAVTRMGEGGIGSSDSIPDDARMVKPSQFGFIDPVQTPECYDAATEVMTDAGWMPWAAVTEDTAFACLIDGQLEFHKAQQLYVSDYTGLMYGAKSAYAEYLVTPNHRMWVRPYDKGDPQYRIETADRTHMRPRKLLCGGHSPYRGNSQATFSLPTITRGGNAQITAAPVATADFAEFLGWFLGEGHVEYKESTSSYQVKITQSMTANPENCSRIAGLLDRIGWSWNYSHNAFAISFKQLAAYLVEFGGSASRCIPVEVFHWPIEARQRLFESLMLAEGRKAKSGVRRCFCSTSHQLALDVQRLVFGLGKSSRLVFEPDDREQANYGGCWVLHVHDRAERIFRKTMRAADSGYYTTHYSGKIYCATVPGGLLYVRRNGLSGVWCGNSNRIGVDGRLTFQTKKGSDGRLYSRFIDAKTGDTQWLSPQDVSNKVVAFPGELQRNQPFVRVLDKGQLRQVPREAVDIALASGSDAFGPMANLIPLKSGIFPQRASMGSRMTTQALALTDAEAPYVQNKVNGQEMSFEKLYGQALGAMVSKTPGTVLSVSPLEIKVRGADGKIQTHELYNNRIFNRKSYLHNTPVVQPGQQIEAGQLLAKSNFTDSTGTAAFGKNARVAFIPNGHNFEDAIVVSEGFAKRMMSEHAYQFDADKEDNITISKNKFVSIFPGKYSRKLLENFDDDGVIRPGTKVNYNDPLILAVKQATVGPRLGRRQSSFREADTIWDHHQPGIVTDVVKTKGGVNVVVKGQQELQVGDKLSGRYGNKGVVAQIVPDGQMPQGRDGRPYEVLYNPLGTISRGNPGAILEAALGKIAETTGKPYNISDFDNIEDLADFVGQEMRKHGVEDLEDLFDPKTGRKIRQVNTGNSYIMKLHHTAEAKAQGRAIGGYSAEGTPAKGGPSGAKRVGMLDLWALLSHGAYNVIRDASVVRGQRNEEMWRQYMSGYTAPPLKIPFVYEKFMNELRAMGINPVRQGTRTQVMALRDSDIDTLAEGREIKSKDTVDWDTDRLAPKKGGLFDEGLTGGHGGKKWSFIKLHEPLPNPLFEEPIKKVLGLTQKEYESILAGTGTPNPLPKGGLAEFSPNNTGPAALQKALQTLNLDKEINRAQLEMHGTRKTARDAAIKRIGFLKSAKQVNVHPSEWIMTKVPVLPPIFRPVTTMSTSKMPLVADPNYLYRDLIEANENLQQLSGKVDDTSEERLALYNTFKALTGLGDPIKPQTQKDKVKGILKHIIGSSPKFGSMQRKLLGSTVDLVGRATIIPNPALDMDQIGIPIEEAWTMYKPFIVRRLVRQGMKHVQALDEVEKRSPVSEKAMLAEMDDRPIMANRAPVLHRYGIMAFKPVPVKGKTLQMPLLVYSGFGADNDGDAMQFHVIHEDSAAKEALDKMLPSRNLISPANFKVHQLPVQEYVAGLHAMTAGESNTPVRTFRSKADAIAAYRRGEINLDQRVQIHDD